jgi:hypothetical protein
MPISYRYTRLNLLSGTQIVALQSEFEKILTTEGKHRRMKGEEFKVC